MSCKEISWLYISGLLFLKEKIFLNQKQVTAEGVKDSRNGKSSTALGLAWKKNSKEEVGLLIDRMDLCNNLGLFLFLLWWDLSHLCCQLRLGVLALILLLRCLFTNSHAVFRKEVLTSFPFPFCSAPHKSQSNDLLLSGPLFVPYYRSHWSGQSCWFSPPTATARLSFTWLSYAETSGPNSCPLASCLALFKKGVWCPACLLNRPLAGCSSCWKCLSLCWLEPRLNIC